MQKACLALFSPEINRYDADVASDRRARGTTICDVALQCCGFDPPIRSFTDVPLCMHAHNMFAEVHVLLLLPLVRNKKYRIKA